MLELNILNVLHLTGSEPYSQTLVAIIAIVFLTLMAKKWHIK